MVFEQEQRAIELRQRPGKSVEVIAMIWVWGNWVMAWNDMNKDKRERVNVTVTSEFKNLANQGDKRESWIADEAQLLAWPTEMLASWSEPSHGL